MITDSPLNLNGDYNANPYQDDYLHRISFATPDVLEMLAGADQRLFVYVRGHYAVHPRGSDTAFVSFADLYELEPWGKNRVLSTLKPFEVKVTYEEGFFAFRYPAPWKVKKEEDQPYVFTEKRYVFEHDPFRYICANNTMDLPDIFTDEQESDRYYYRQGHFHCIFKRQIDTLRSLSRE